MNYQSKNPESLAQIPSIVYDESDINYQVPLGWCYGDQTGSIALYSAGKVLQNEKLMEQAIAIAVKTTERDTVVKASRSELTDAGLCHGMAGVAFLHKTWYQITGDERFYDQYNYFKNQVLKRGNHNDSISGFKKYMGEEDGHIDAIGLLDGSCGIGVFLIDSILESNLDWGELFLLK